MTYYPNTKERIPDKPPLVLRIEMNKEEAAILAKAVLTADWGKHVGVGIDLYAILDQYCHK